MTKSYFYQGWKYDVTLDVNVRFDTVAIDSIKREDGLLIDVDSPVWLAIDNMIIDDETDILQDSSFNDMLDHADTLIDERKYDNF